MPINQREVYMYNHPFHKPGDDHPFIVLSNIDANYQENTFVCVMITASETTKDDFSFELTDAMFERPLAKKNCHVRMHLIITAFGEDKGKYVNTMKPLYFNQLMASIGDLVFDYDFSPFNK